MADAGPNQKRRDDRQPSVWVVAIDNDELIVDPCARLKLPVVRNNRTRIEAPAMAEALIAALPDEEQAFWALAFYNGRLAAVRAGGRKWRVRAMNRKRASRPKRGL